MFYISSSLSPSPSFPFLLSVKHFATYVFKSATLHNLIYVWFLDRSRAQSSEYRPPEGVQLWKELCWSAEWDCTCVKINVHPNSVTVFIYKYTFSLSRSIDQRMPMRIHLVMLLAPFGPWISQVFLLWRNQCSDRSIKACSPTEQGYGKVRRGICGDKHKSGSSSQVAVAFYQRGRGRSRQPWWFDGACSSGSRCTVHSTGACRPECCSSPGEQAWWGLVMCSWPCNAPAVPAKETACTNT